MRNVFINFIIEISLTYPEILSDIFNGIFFILLFVAENIKDIINKTEEGGTEDNEDKGKGRATREQEEEWDKELEANKSLNSGSSDDDDDDEKNKADQIKIDELLAKSLQHEDVNPNNIISSYASSYSVLSSDFDEEDDNERANKKLDIAELELRLRAEKDKLEQEKDISYESKKRYFDEEGESSYKSNKRNKNT